ncbi:MAG: hypothetical protein ACQES9_02730 [Myxococcota bacterium]
MNNTPDNIGNGFVKIGSDFFESGYNTFDSCSKSLDTALGCFIGTIDCSSKTEKTVVD